MTETAIEEFWRAYCASRGDAGTCVKESYDAWAFGDGKPMADELGGLVLRGIKTAAAGLPWEDEYFGWKSPVVGDKTIILDGDGAPLCVIETTEAVVRTFDTVDASFARLEGEGFTGIEDWRRAHWDYFSRRCKEIGKEPGEQMPVLCQQFRVVYPR